MIFTGREVTKICDGEVEPLVSAILLEEELVYMEEVEEADAEEVEPLAERLSGSGSDS